MPEKKAGRINRRFYPRDAVLTKAQLAGALQCSERQVERMSLPTAYLGTQSPRWIWGQVLDTLAERASKGVA